MKQKSLFLRLLIFTAAFYFIVVTTTIPVARQIDRRAKISPHETSVFLVKNSELIPFQLLQELALERGVEIYIKSTDGIPLFSSSNRDLTDMKTSHGKLKHTAISDKKLDVYTHYPSHYQIGSNKRFFIILTLIYGSAITMMLFMMTRLLRNHVKTVNQQIKRVSEGDFETQIDVSPYREFSELDEAVNIMIRETGNKIVGLSAEIAEHINIFDGLIDGVLVLNSDNHIYMMNRSAEAYLGLSRDRVNGKHILAVLLIGELRELLERENQLTAEYTHHDYIFTAEKLYLDNQTVLVIRDITEQNEIKRSKTDFVSNVSHELRTPLTLIKGFAETLEVEELSEEQMRYVQTIIRHSNRVISIVKDLLTLSRLEQESHMEFNRIDVCNIIEEILSIYSFKADEKNVELRFDDCSEMYIMGDRNLMEIVISNLVDNAIKYNESGGYVTVMPWQKDGMLHIDVRDNGIGIPRQDKTRVFERFYTVDKVRSRKVGGTGLGLAISKHIVLLHGGRITIHPNEDRGTIFRISIPAS